MKYTVKQFLHTTLQALTNLKRIASLTLALPFVVTASLPATLNAQSLTLLQPQTTVLASGFGNARQIAVDGSGNVFVPNNTGGITKITPYGTQSVAPGTAGLWPNGVAVDGADNLWVSASGTSLVAIAPNGTRSYLGGNFEEADLVAADPYGNIYVTDPAAGTVQEFSAQSASFVTVATNVFASGLAVDSLGDIYLSNQANNQVIELEAGGGSQDSERVLATVSGATAVAVDRNFDLFISTSNSVLEYPAGGEQFTVLSGVSASSMAMYPAGYLFALNQNTNQILKATFNSADFGSTSVCPNWNNCGENMTLTYGVMATGPMTVIVADGHSTQSNDFTITNSNCQSAAAGSTCTVNIKFGPVYPGLRTGALQFVENNGTVAAQTMLHGVGQGPEAAFDGAAPQQLASVSNPSAVNVDPAGNILFVTSNEVEFISATNLTNDIVLYSGLSQGSAVAGDSAGNVYAGDMGNQDVLKITPTVGSNTVSTVATGVCPMGLAADAIGNVYIADSCHNRVVELVAATGAQLSLGSGLNNPVGVALDSSGNLYIADALNLRVVEISASTGNQTTVADGFPGLGGVAVDAAGNLIIVCQEQVVELPASGATPIVLSPQVDQAGVALDPQGDIFFEQSAYSQILEVKRSHPPSLTFPQTAVGSSSSVSTTMENIGNQQLTAVPPGLGSAFSYYSLEAGSGDCTTTFSLAPAASCNISISFTPTSTGTITGDYVVNDNSLNHSMVTQIINLSGTAVQ